MKTIIVLVLAAMTWSSEAWAETERLSPSVETTTSSTPQIEHDIWMDKGLEAICNAVGYAFTHWDAESRKCIAIDLSSDTVYEQK